MSVLKVGIVGARGLSTLQGFRAMPDRAEVVAMCDLDEELLNKVIGERRIPRGYRVFEDMLASDIDAVVVATPMQLHVPQSIAALQAGKHVLCEVTAAVQMDELFWLIEEVEKSRRTYMFAENCCYIPQVQQVQAMAEAGLFGDCYFGEGEYLHDIKYLRRYQDAKVSWRNYWQLGKRGAFYPTHSLGPVMKWMRGERIEEVVCMGVRGFTDPSIRQDDTTLTLLKTSGGRMVKLRVDCVSFRPHEPAYYSLQGTKGCYEAPRGMGDDHKVYLHDGSDNSNRAAWRPLSDFSGYLPERYKNATPEQLACGHWGSDFFIVQDFIHAAVSGEKPAIDVYDACEWTAVALLSELSVTNGARAVRMPYFRKNMPQSEQRIEM